MASHNCLLALAQNIAQTVNAMPAPNTTPQNHHIGVDLLVTAQRGKGAPNMAQHRARWLTPGQVAHNGRQTQFVRHGLHAAYIWTMGFEEKRRTSKN